MLQIQRGRVKFYRKDQGWGFIQPADGSQDVYFHVDYYSGVSEPYDGELHLGFYSDATLTTVLHAPEKGEWIVYESLFQTSRGRSMAIHWLFPETVQRAELMLAQRSGSPSNFHVRVRHHNPEVKGSAAFTTFWEGTREEFDRKLDEGFSQMLDTNFWVERLLINGEWERMWHPTGWHPKYRQQA